MVSNPLDRAAAFRHQQNHLRGPLRGVAGVTYAPPPPELCRSLMEELITFANERPDNVPSLILASVISFGFVFLHPFMDGNGRLSRFLVHQTLCSRGELEHGALLPISVAMKKNEAVYLEALRSFSGEIKKHWDITWVDGQEYLFAFKGASAIYRYWDATACTEFLLDMAEQALEIGLRAETRFLANYDKLIKSMDERFDILEKLAGQLLSQEKDTLEDDAGPRSHELPNPPSTIH